MGLKINKKLLTVRVVYICLILATVIIVFVVLLSIKNDRDSVQYRFLSEYYSSSGDISIPKSEEDLEKYKLKLEPYSTTELIDTLSKNRKIVNCFSMDIYEGYESSIKEIVIDKSGETDNNYQYKYKGILLVKYESGLIEEYEVSGRLDITKNNDNKVCNFYPANIEFEKDSPT